MYLKEEQSTSWLSSYQDSQNSQNSVEQHMSTCREVEQT